MYLSLLNKIDMILICNNMYENIAACNCTLQNINIRRNYPYFIIHFSKQSVLENDLLKEKVFENEI